MITSEKISHLQKRLEEERDRLKKEIAAHGNHPVTEHDAGDSDLDADDAEEFANELAAAGTLRERLEEVENAINRMKEGTYGTCEQCGVSMDEKVLEASPAMPYCRNCMGRG